MKPGTNTVRTRDTQGTLFLEVREGSEHKHIIMQHHTTLHIVVAITTHTEHLSLIAVVGHKHLHIAALIFSAGHQFGNFGGDGGGKLLREKEDHLEVCLEDK